MKVILPGGTGQVGAILTRALEADGHEVVVLTRRPTHAREVAWDGRTLGPWAATLDGADAVVNLAGRSVSCRYSPANLAEMMASRVDSARVVGQAIAAAERPPRVWLQMSTATIYAHAGEGVPAHDETRGVLGGTEPDVPGYWEFSIRIARNWEREQELAATPHTRKVALRSAMVMSPDTGGVFDVLLGLTRLGLGGPVAGGGQYVSWIHDVDFVRAVRFLIESDGDGDTDGDTALSGPVNLAAPEPLPQREFMSALRQAWGTPVRLPATRQMARLGALVLRSDAELLLKSRRVVPGALRDAGFTFEHGQWHDAAADLVDRVRAQQGSGERRGTALRSVLTPAWLRG
ncbi:epimerase [Streptacidiphilus fuscans]|uniref:DUF1731 domain-containing protein n=1 Tax=Streptacidiphilus fuscans TaxID=2789292 RepID=A0A931B3Y9_9ACTN|nr:DUF1731 domain-containing protein [Streptacidiphilus fuscans]MBF9069894.1 DUF1731 domain-containing protein [Streptacidiphilus fuscans]